MAAVSNTKDTPVTRWEFEIFAEAAMRYVAAKQSGSKHDMSSALADMDRIIKGRTEEIDVRNFRTSETEDRRG